MEAPLNRAQSLNRQILADIITRRPELGFIYVVPRHERSHVEYSMWSFRVERNELVKSEMEHSTIGPTGVTRIVDGETEFTPLDRWRQEYQFYVKLAEIRLFKNFRKAKTFTTWHKNVRQDKVNNAKKQLTANL